MPANVISRITSNTTSDRLSERIVGVRSIFITNAEGAAADMPAQKVSSFELLLRRARRRRQLGVRGRAITTIA